MSVPRTLRVPLICPLPTFPLMRMGSVVLSVRFSFHLSNGAGMGRVSCALVFSEGSEMLLVADDGMPMGMRSMSL